MRGGNAKRRRLLLLALLLVCGALFFPASSQAFVACSSSGGELTVNLTADDDSVTFQRFGPQIAVLTGNSLDEYGGYDYGDESQILIPCSGGTPTVDNTDHVSVLQSPGADLGSVAIDQSAGPFGPGATSESDGTSEIEFGVSLPGRLSELFVGGTDASEVFTIGTEPSGSPGVNMNASTSSDPDVEVASSRYIVVHAEGGNDLVTALGGPGFVGPLRGAFAIADGGLGKDVLLAGPNGSGFEGEEGHDRLVGSPREDFLEGGPGKDKILARGGNDDIDALDRKKDRVICGSGKRDRATVDTRDRIKGCERGRRITFPGHRQRPRIDPLSALIG
jgi:hemolysin type calcium-binding protein